MLYLIVFYIESFYIESFHWCAILYILHLIYLHFAFLLVCRGGRVVYYLLYLILFLIPISGLFFMARRPPTFSTLKNGKLSFQSIFNCFVYLLNQLWILPQALFSFLLPWVIGGVWCVQKQLWKEYLICLSSFVFADLQ